MRNLILMTLLFVWALQTPAGTSASTFNYQGRLVEAGTPVAGPVNLAFRLFDADTAGVQIGPELTLLNFSNFGDGGEFTVDLDFGAGAFPGDARWLEVWVDGAPLTPRQPVRPTPHALHAVTAEMVPDGGLPSTYSSAVNFSNAGNSFSGAFTGSGAGLTNLDWGNLTNVPAGFADGVDNDTIVWSTSGGNAYYNAGKVGIGNANPTYPLHVETGSGGADHAIYGRHAAGSGTTSGVFGLSLSMDGRGVSGHAGASSGTTYGVRGTSASTGGRAVFGFATASSGTTYGVRGQSNSTSGRGLYGAAFAISGTTYGVYGLTNSPDGYAGYFSGPEGSKNHFQRNVGIGTESPLSMLHVFGAENNGTDAAVRIVSGEQTMLLDGNEIDSFPAGLYLNHNVAHNVLIATGGGNVGIGTTAPAQLLSVNGTAGKPGGGSWSTFSDARLKKNIQPLTGSLDQLLALHGVMFEYRDPDTINELPGIRIGMIAQDVEKVFPDWVSDSPSGYKSLSFSGFEALTVEALRELIGKLVKQESAAQRQRQELAALAEENDRMRERLAGLELKVEAMLAGSRE